jgi:hypothetical protein
MIFRQLFEPESSPYTYLFACRETGQAILLDPMIETTDEAEQPGRANGRQN